MSDKEIPNIIVGRLPLYLRSLQRMKKEDRRITSSQELGERIGISAAQIRKTCHNLGNLANKVQVITLIILSNRFVEFSISTRNGT